jgi:hypothetical protein
MQTTKKVTMQVTHIRMGVKDRRRVIEGVKVRAARCPYCWSASNKVQGHASGKPKKLSPQVHPPGPTKSPVP